MTDDLNQLSELWIKAKEQDRIGRHTGIAPITRRKAYTDIHSIQIPQG